MYFIAHPPDSVSGVVNPYYTGKSGKMEGEKRAEKWKDAI